VARRRHPGTRRSGRYPLYATAHGRAWSFSLNIPTCRVVTAATRLRARSISELPAVIVNPTPIAVTVAVTGATIYQGASSSTPVPDEPAHVPGQYHHQTIGCQNWNRAWDAFTYECKGDRLVLDRDGRPPQPYERGWKAQCWSGLARSYGSSRGLRVLRQVRHALPQPGLRGPLHDGALRGGLSVRQAAGVAVMVAVMAAKSGGHSWIVICGAGYESTPRLPARGPKLRSSGTSVEAD